MALLSTPKNPEPWQLWVWPATSWAERLAAATSTDRVLLYTTVGTAHSGMIPVSLPAPLWSVAATGEDRHLITRNSAFFSLPSLSGISDY